VACVLDDVEPHLDSLVLQGVVEKPGLMNRHKWVLLAVDHQERRRVFREVGHRVRLRDLVLVLLIGITPAAFVIQAC
jgi:hypothetical protein